MGYPTNTDLANYVGVEIVDPSEVKENDPINVNRIDAGFTLGENVGGDTDWVFKSYTFTTHADTYFVRLRAPMGLSGRAMGQVWFDRVAIEKVE